jgi:hypothetical protein
MTERLTFADKESFLAHLHRLVAEGVPRERIRVILPFHVPEAEEILPRRLSRVRFFALIGAAAGTVTGFVFTILTSLSWPIIVGGKPVVSIPPFVIIAFALTILFGSLSTFAGFLILSRLPNLSGIRAEDTPGNTFVILVDEKGRRP